MSFTNSFTTVVSALKSFSQGLQVIGDNIANVNTTGYKSSRPEYSDSFSNMLSSSTPSGGGDTSNTPSVQVGTGVKLTNISSMFTDGPVQYTGVKTDLAIVGDGFFQVRDPLNDTLYATRAGNFRWDDQSYLVTPEGFRVQGPDGDIEFNPTIPQNATVQGYYIDESGQVNVNFSDGTTGTAGASSQIGLMNFRDPQALIREGSNLFSGFDAAGQIGSLDVPGANSTGLIESESLELSNVDLTEEFSNMIMMQRSFQASARVVNTADQVLQEVINLKR